MVRHYWCSLCHCSACPGWICYAEKTHGELLPYISNVKSAQQIMGTLVKEWLAPQLGLTREQVYHVSVMPCYDKKLEASRPDFATEDGNRDVDCVLTTGEVQRILDEKGITLADVSLDQEEDEGSLILPSLLAHAGSASGGFLHNAISAAIRAQPAETLSNLILEEKVIRGEDYSEYNLRSGNSVIFRGAKCYGFRNLQNVVRKVGRETGISVTKGAAGKGAGIKRGGMMKRGARASASEEPEKGYDFIEVMACPSGCVNGGGQISPPKHPLPIQVDREGMPVIPEDAGEHKVVVDEHSGHRVLSGKEWVSRVEEFYWQIGAVKIAESAGQIVHDSIKPYLPTAQHSRYDKLAEDIIAAMVAASEKPEEARHLILRTQYRAIESSEVNGLAVKW
jgi:iron only hydrogenase large subunit-like protein